MPGHSAFRGAGGVPRQFVRSNGHDVGDKLIMPARAPSPRPYIPRRVCPIGDAGGARALSELGDCITFTDHDIRTKMSAIQASKVDCPLWVRLRYLHATGLSALLAIADTRSDAGRVRDVPCVDGSVLARAFFTFAALVGVAMCSACLRGSQDRWP
jgi:hypothetical protein